MKKTPSKLALQLVGLIALTLIFTGQTQAASSSALPIAAVPPQQTNLLQNPGFEDPYSGGVAQNWAPWHAEFNSNPKPENCSDRYGVLPKWEPEIVTDSLKRDGARSQHVGNNWDTWQGGVMQTVNVTAGSTYQFSFLAIGRAAGEQFPTPSDGSVNMGVRAGADPNGSGLWLDGDVVWGTAGSPHDSGNQANWQQFSVQVTATGNKVTVFTQADFTGANKCRKHMDVWFDSAQLVEVGPPPTATSPPPPPPPPAPVVTNTPVPPTATPTPEATPTETPVPSPTPTSTPTGGSICINAFADTSGNGQRDSGEGFMAGVTFTIAQDNNIIGQGVSTGTENPICFEGIPSGNYTVGQVIPRTLELTTSPSAPVQVADGATVSLEFGSRFKTTGEEVASLVTPTTEAVSIVLPEGDSDGDSDFSPTAIIGLVAIFLAILLLAALIIILLRQGRR